jgi:hypothetical protein
MGDVARRIAGGGAQCIHCRGTDHGAEVETHFWLAGWLAALCHFRLAVIWYPHL